jgi:hypothetical protein
MTEHGLPHNTAQSYWHHLSDIPWSYPPGEPRVMHTAAFCPSINFTSGLYFSSRSWTKFLRRLWSPERGPRWLFFILFCPAQDFSRGLTKKGRNTHNFHVFWVTQGSKYQAPTCQLLPPPPSLLLLLSSLLRFQSLFFRKWLRKRNLTLLLPSFPDTPSHVPTLDCNAWASNKASIVWWSNFLLWAVRSSAALSS